MIFIKEIRNRLFGADSAVLEDEFSEVAWCEDNNTVYLTDVHGVTDEITVDELCVDVLFFIGRCGDRKKVIDDLDKVARLVDCDDPHLCHGEEVSKLANTYDEDTCEMADIIFTLWWLMMVSLFYDNGRRVYCDEDIYDRDI